MPLQYKIDAELGLIYYAGIGSITGSEMLRAEQMTAQDPQRQPSMKIIIDLSSADLDIAMNEFYEGIVMNRKRMEKGNDPESTAIVSRSRFAPILADAFRLLGKGLPLKFGVFTTLPDAVAWLELDGQAERIFQIQNELKDALKRAQ